MLNFVHSIYLHASAYYAHSVYFCAVKFPRFEKFINATNPISDIPDAISQRLKIPIIVTLINPLGKAIQQPLFFPISNRRPKLSTVTRRAASTRTGGVIGRFISSSGSWCALQPRWNREREKERERGRFSIRLLFVFFPLLPSFR